MQLLQQSKDWIYYCKELSLNCFNFMKMAKIMKMKLSKKIVTASAKMGIILFMFFMPLLAHAQNFAQFTVPNRCNQEECGWNDLIALGSEILQFAIYLAVLGATVSFIVAGWKMMMNQGNSGEIEKAKGIMAKAAIGLVLTMCAWLLVDFILDNLGVGAEFRTFIQ